MSLLSDILLPTPRSAELALESVGAAWDPRLDLDAEIDGVRVARRFGVLRNPLACTAEDDRILASFREVIQHASNVRQRERAAALTFCPVNKTVLTELADSLLGGRVHLPFTLRPMMLDLAAKIDAIEDLFPFEAFYARSVQVRTGPRAPGSPRAGAQLKPGRLFSVPVGGDAEATRIEPLDDQELDLRVGLLLEVDAFGE
jgi:hypothetical protein